jgi:tetratricopeptide (TPR) repeat protein
MQSGSEEGNRHLAAAVGCMKTGDYVAAIKVLDALVAREPEFAEAHFQRGLALAAADRIDRAEDAYRQALRLNPYHFGAAAALGHACVERGQLHAALHFYRQALRVHPQLEDVPDVVQELESVIGARRSNGV